MSKEMSVIVLGLWVAIVPYLGFPGSIKTLFIVLSGLALAVIGFLLRGKSFARSAKTTHHHPFVENTAPKQPVADTLSDIAE